jgi:hypothetical protein
MRANKINTLYILGNGYGYLSNAIAMLHIDIEHIGIKMRIFCDGMNGLFHD